MISFDEMVDQVVEDGLSESAVVSNYFLVDYPYAQGSYPIVPSHPTRLGEEIVFREVSPPGFKGTVKAMKKHKDITNPYALGWWMKKRGWKSHKKADGTDK